MPEQADGQYNIIGAAMICRSFGYDDAPGYCGCGDMLLSYEVTAPAFILFV